MGRIFVILGKSASGKDSIFRELSGCKELNLKTVIPYTTRPVRSGEVSGRDYHFVSEEDFLRFKEQNKVIESRSYNTVHGIWNYFTVDDGQIDRKGNYLMIGTLQSYLSLKKYFDKDDKKEGFVIPIYIHVEDGERLSRALSRERSQKEPKFEEMCRRFMADQEDFSEERLTAAGITKKYENYDFNLCFSNIKSEILSKIC